MIFLPSSCEIGTVAMNQAPMWVVNGKRTGKTSNAYVESLTYRVGWCVYPAIFIHSPFTLQGVSRSTCQESIGSEYSSLQSGHGRAATRQTPMSGVMGTRPCVDPHRGATHAMFTSEIKFGALFDNLPEGTDFLATGQSSTSPTSVLRSMYGPQVIMHAKAITHKITAPNSCARETCPKTRLTIFRLSRNPASTRHSSHSPTSQRPKSVRSPTPRVYTMPRARRAWAYAS